MQLNDQSARRNTAAGEVELLRGPLDGVMEVDTRNRRRRDIFSRPTLR